MESLVHIFVYIGGGALLLFFLYGIYFSFFIHRAITSGKITKPFSRSVPQAPTRILIIGDSTAYGTGAKDSRNSIAGRLAQDFPNVSIVNASQNAMDIVQLAHKLESLKHERFDHIMIQIGGIDTLRFTRIDTIEKYMNIVAHRARAITEGSIFLVSVNNVGALPLMLFPFTTLYARRSNAVTECFARVVSSTDGVVHIPLYTDRANDPLCHDPTRFFAHDRIHPNDAGYALWYEKIRTILAISMT